MKRKTAALITALTLVFSLSACRDKTVSQAEVTDTTSVEETTEEAKVTEESTPEEEPTPEISPEEKVQSALGEMPYYGDTSKCAMTAEQATAYAQLIADGLSGDFSFRGGYHAYADIVSISWSEPFQIMDPFFEDNTYEAERFNVMLGDFANDGIPYLYLFNNGETYYEEYFEIYGWKDGRAELTFEKPLATSTLYCLYETEDEQERIKLSEESPMSLSHYISRYSFHSGTMEEDYTYSEDLLDDGNTHIIENGVETAVYTPEEYSQYYTPFLTNDYAENHNHTLPYTCFYNMTPCTLEEMVNYLNAYATVMSGGQSVPVEIKKVDIVKHDGTGITTKGEVPQEKIDILEILRQYMNGEKEMGIDYDIYAYKGDPGSVTVDSDGFYFGSTDLNNDGNQELLVSYKNMYTDIFLPSVSKDALIRSLKGVNESEGKYMKESGSVSTIVTIYNYNGTEFSVISELDADNLSGASCIIQT